jgi:hypothetical protein
MRTSSINRDKPAAPQNETESLADYFEGSDDMEALRSNFEDLINNTDADENLDLGSFEDRTPPTSLRSIERQESTTSVSSTKFKKFNLQELQQQALADELALQKSTERFLGVNDSLFTSPLAKGGMQQELQPQLATSLPELQQRTIAEETSFIVDAARVEQNYQEMRRKAEHLQRLRDQAKAKLQSAIDSDLQKSKPTAPTQRKQSVRKDADKDDESAKNPLAPAVDPPPLATQGNVNYRPDLNSDSSRLASPPQTQDETHPWSADTNSPTHAQLADGALILDPYPPAKEPFNRTNFISAVVGSVISRAAAQAEDGLDYKRRIAEMKAALDAEDVKHSSLRSENAELKKELRRAQDSLDTVSSFLQKLLDQQASCHAVLLGSAAASNDCAHICSQAATELLPGPQSDDFLALVLPVEDHSVGQTILHQTECEIPCIYRHRPPISILTRVEVSLQSSTSIVARYNDCIVQVKVEHIEDGGGQSAHHRIHFPLLLWRNMFPQQFSDEEKGTETVKYLKFSDDDTGGQLPRLQLEGCGATHQDVGDPTSSLPEGIAEQIKAVLSGHDRLYSDVIGIDISLKHVTEKLERVHIGSSSVKHVLTNLETRVITGEQVTVDAVRARDQATAEADERERQMLLRCEQKTEELKAQVALVNTLRDTLENKMSDQERAITAFQAKVESETAGAKRNTMYSGGPQVVPAHLAHIVRHGNVVVDETDGNELQCISELQLQVSNLNDEKKEWMESNYGLQARVAQLQHELQALQHEKLKLAMERQQDLTWSPAPINSDSAPLPASHQMHIGRRLASDLNRIPLSFDTTETRASNSEFHSNGSKKTPGNTFLRDIVQETGQI